MRKVGLLAVVLACGVFFAACSLQDLKTKAGLQVETKVGDTDVPASLYLDGKYLDKTPYANNNIEPGDYTLEIRPDNSAFVPYQTSISLKKGVLTFVLWQPGDRAETSGGVIYETEQLQDPHDSELSITTIPDGGIIRVDDQAKGFAPVLVEHISAGEHSYEVTLPSFETQKNTINVLEGFRMNVTVKLAQQILETPTASQSASPSAQVVASPSPAISNPTLPATSSASVLGSSTNAVIPKPKVHILSTQFFQNGQEVLRVRSAADAGAGTVGYAPVGTEYPYLQQTTDGWFKISFNNQTGWVSTQYAQLIQ